MGSIWNRSSSFGDESRADIQPKVSPGSRVHPSTPRCRRTRASLRISSGIIMFPPCNLATPTRCFSAEKGVTYDPDRSQPEDSSIRASKPARSRHFAIGRPMPKRSILSRRPPRPTTGNLAFGIGRPMTNRPHLTGRPPRTPRPVTPELEVLATLCRASVFGTRTNRV